MRKIAALLLIAFTLLQAGPLISSIFSDQPLIVMIDEEKAGDHQPEQDNKVKKDFAGYPAQSAYFSRQLIIAFHLTEQLLPAPCLEKHTPPPNHC